VQCVTTFETLPIHERHCFKGCDTLLCLLCNELYDCILGKVVLCYVFLIAEIDTGKYEGESDRTLKVQVSIDTF